MEQWEKEYLAIIERQKKLQESKKANNEFINTELWEERIRADGTKWYIPKQEKFDRLKKKSNSKKNRIAFFFFQKIFRFIIICIVVVLLFFISHSLKNYFSHTSSDLPVSYNLDLTGDTLVNGLGMYNMATILFDIRDTQTETLNEFVLRDYSFSDKEIEDWSNSIKQDLNSIDNLNYHKSYSAVVNGYISLLDTLQVFLMEIEDGNIKSARAIYNEYFAISSDLKYIFADALKKNGVNHAVSENGITFSYYLY